MVRFVSDRKDVDRKRIAVLGHGEGAAVALLAAAKEKRIAAVVLASASGVSGADLNVYQVTHAMERSGKSPADQQSTIDLQKRIQTAVLSGRGWEGIDADIRKQAESPWFASFLAFDPAPIIGKLDQPLFVIQGALDKQVPPHHAEKLGALANARKNAPKTDVIVLPGVNHLLVPAKTGELSEYGSLPDRTISPDVAAKVAAGDALGRGIVAKKDGRRSGEEAENRALFEYFKRRTEARRPQAGRHHVRLPGPT